MAGYQGDAHELVNRTLVPEAKRTNLPLITVLEKLAGKDVYLGETLNKIPEEIQKLFRHPENYIGKAKEKAKEIAFSARQQINS